MAAVSDIHGNVLALEAVLADIQAFSPDLVVNLGDHVSGPLWAAETADVLMAQENWLQIRGNHDRQVTTLAKHEMGLSDRAAHAQLSSRQLEWIRQLPSVLAFDFDGEKVLLCHGTVQRDNEYLLEDVSAGFARAATPDAIRELADGFEGLLLCGHSHLPQLVQVGDSLTVANPGSVGLPGYRDSSHRFPHAIQTGSPHARYLLLDHNSKGWTANFRNIVYDCKQAAELAATRGRADWSYSLLTGFAPEA